MNVSYINAFICAVNETFTSMVKMFLVVGEPVLKKNCTCSAEITGSVGLSGNAQGFIALSYPGSVAIKIVSKLTGVEFTDIGPDVIDGIGKITNVVADNAKQHISNLLLSISLPTVIVGSEYKLFSISQVPVIVVPLKSDAGDFFMELALRT
jgi:chemotaxis protein CheX